MLLESNLSNTYYYYQLSTLKTLTCRIARFSPEIVWDLEDDQIDYLGAEDDNTMKNRADLQEKLRVLEDGLKELDAFTARPDSSTRHSV